MTIETSDNQIQHLK